MSVLRVVLGLDAKQFQSGCASAALYANRFGTSLRGSLLAALGPIAIAMEAINIVKESFQDASQIADLSDKYRVNGEELQRIALVGKRVGLEMEDVARLMKDLNKAIAEGATDPKKAKQLEKIGISAEALASGNLSATDAFYMISAAMDGAGNKSALLKALMDNLGKSGQAVAAMLEMSHAEILKISKDAPVMSDAMTQMADDLGDSLTDVWKVIKIIGLWIAGLIGALIGAIGVILGSVATIFVGVYQGLLWVIKNLMELLAATAKALGMSGLAKSLDEGSKAVDRHMDSVTRGIEKTSGFAVASGEMAGRTLGAMFGVEREKKEKKKGRNIPGLEDEVKGGKEKTLSVQAIQVVGGGGLAAGASNLVLRQVELAQKQLEEQKTTNELLKQSAGGSSPAVTSGGSASGTPPSVPTIVPMGY